MRTRFINATIWDASRPSPERGLTVDVADGVIVGIRAPSVGDPLPAVDDTLDLGGRFLLPGIWDAHAHLSLVPHGDLARRPPLEPPIERAIRAGRTALAALRSGITSLRIVGEAYGVDIAWKKAFASGAWLGPSLYVCGSAIAATGGHGRTSGVSVEVDGPEGFRRAVREQLKLGADQIKVMVTGGIGTSPRERPDHAEVSRAELRAAVEAAHDRNVIVGAHVGGGAAAKMALEEGIDVMEHGYLLDDEIVRIMSAKGTYLVPTLLVSQPDDDDLRAHGWAEYAITNARRVRPRHRHSFDLARDAGVKIAAGDDSDSIVENLPRELEYLQRAGMTTHEVLIAATLTPAEICGVSNDVGTIAVDKTADLIAVDGDPVSDIGAVRSVALVMKGGQVAVNRLPPRPGAG